MQKTWTTVLEMFEKYTNGSWHIILLAVALLYLLLTIKKKKENVIFIVFSLLFAGLYLCPYTADLIMKNFIGRSVYWRMFWILPSILIIAYAGALFISRFRAKGIQAVLLAVMVTVIGANSLLLQGLGSVGRAREERGEEPGLRRQRQSGAPAVQRLRPSSGA